MPQDPWWLKALNEWVPDALALTGAAVLYKLRDWVSGLKNPDRKGQKQWLTSEEIKVREMSTQISRENDDLRAQVKSLEKEVLAERKSGMGHYTKTVRLYDLIVKLMQDWHRGKEPPTDTPDFDKI